MSEVNLITLIVAVLGAGGIGATIREIVSAIVKLFDGKSARESTRKTDIVEQRDVAVYERDLERRNQRVLEEALAEMRRKAIESGTPIVELPMWPDLEKTLPPERIRHIIKQSEENSG